MISQAIQSCPDGWNQEFCAFHRSGLSSAFSTGAADRSRQKESLSSLQARRCSMRRAVSADVDASVMLSLRPAGAPGSFARRPGRQSPVVMVSRRSKRLHGAVLLSAERRSGNFNRVGFRQVGDVNRLICEVEFCTVESRRVRALTHQLAKRILQVHAIGASSERTMGRTQVGRLIPCRFRERRLRWG